MGHFGADRRTKRPGVFRGFALCAMLVLVGLAVAGPSGMFAWNENHRRLIERRQELAHLAEERAELRNRVALLDPRHVDPDLAGELVRAKLNVVHPDEMVMLVR